MVDNIVTKTLGLVLIITAHMVFNGHSHEITGILCNNITLKFILNDTITKSSHFAVYRSGLKIAECSSNCTAPDGCNVHRGKVSVFFNISNLKLNHSGTYYATLFLDTKLPKESNRVELRVQEDNSSCTDSPMPTNSTIPEHRGSSTLFVFYIVTVLVVLSVVLLVAVLSWLIWCLVRKDHHHQQQQQQQQQSSYPTVQGSVEASYNVPTPSVVYSILDFPKRPPAVLEMNPNDTEYAAVSYLPEQRRV